MRQGFFSRDKRFIVKIVPHHSSRVYKFEFSHAHAAVIGSCFALLMAGGLIVHFADMATAQAQVMHLEAITATQAKQLVEFSSKTRVLWSRLDELKKQNDEIRRMTGLHHPASVRRTTPVKSAQSDRQQQHAAAALPVVGGLPAALAGVDGSSVWAHVQSWLPAVTRMSFTAQRSQLSALDAASATAIADAVTLKAQVRIAEEKKHEAEIARQAALDAIPSIWPTSGSITSCFCYRSYPDAGFHAGLDIVNDYGQPVYATAAGVIVAAGWDGGYGYKIAIDHGNGYETWYAHNSRLLVNVGQRVRKGEEIALVGSTGFATGPHVHYQVMLFGKAIDPAPYLNGIPKSVALSQ